MSRLSVVALTGLTLCPSLASGAPPAPASPQKTDTIVVEGATTVAGVALDPVNGRLLVSTGSEVSVLDLVKKEKVGTVAGVERARGVAVIADPHRGFAASAKNDRLVAFDADTYEVKKEIPAGSNPDGVLALTSAREVWAFATKTNTATCIDPLTFETKATVAFEGSPQNGVEHASRGVVYVTVTTPDVIAVVSVAQHKVLATHTLSVGAEPEGIALDAKNGLLFVTCRTGKMVAVETSGWKVVGSWEIGVRSGGAAFDPGTGNAFGLGEDRIRVVHVTSPRKLDLLPSLEVPGARSCLLDPKGRRLFVTSGPKKGEEGPVQVTIFAPK